MSAGPSRLVPRLVAGVLLVVGALAWWVLAGDAGTQRTDEAQPGQHVYAGFTEEPEHLNPFTVVGQVARRYVLGFTHDTLLDVDPRTGDLRPALATAWQHDADGKGFTLDLRDGVQFSDGSTCTPQDVLFTFAAARALGQQIGSMADGMRLVESAELLPGKPNRLHVRLHERHFAALRAVCESWIVVREAWFLRTMGGLAVIERKAPPESPADPSFGQLLVKVTDCGPGTGPYRLAENTDGTLRWQRGRLLEMEHNPRSWRRTAHPERWHLAGIRLWLMRDEASRISKLKERAIDWFGGRDIDVMLEQDPTLAADYVPLRYDYQNLGVMLFTWNCRREPLDKVEVRRALDMLLDRQAIIDTVMGGDGAPAAAFHKRGSRSYPESLQPRPQDLELARGMLRAAGYGGEKPLRLRVLAPDEPRHQGVIAELADAARRVGIDLQVRTVEWSVMAQTVADGEWEGVLRLQNHRSYVDPFELFHSTGAGNVMGWHDAEADRLLASARIELDDERREGLFLQFNERVRDQAPVSFVFHPLVRVLFNRHIENAQPGFLGLWPERFRVAPEFARR